jgi:hypothetical protein
MPVRSSNVPETLAGFCHPAVCAHESAVSTEFPASAVTAERPLIQPSLQLFLISVKNRP